jgi:ribonuclease G
MSSYKVRRGLTSLQFLAKEIPMSKELFISSSPHETKVAVLEDDGLVEVFYQRDTDVGLVGGIYKGRVSRVLPGMQSAFVDIGLERDAFLYVSDFFEDSDEYDRVASEAETRVSKFVSGESRAAEHTESPAPTQTETSVASTEAIVNEAAATPVLEAAGGDQATDGSRVAAPTSEPAAPSRGEGQSQQTPRPWQESRGRGRRRRRGRGFDGSHEFRESRPAHTAPASPSTFEVLPGESLARHSQAAAEPAPTASDDEHATMEVASTIHELPSDLAQENMADERAIPVLGAVPSLETPSSLSSAGAEPQRPEEASALLNSLEVEVEALEQSDETPEERLEEDLLAGNLRVTPVSVEPDAPSHAIQPATASDQPANAATVVAEPAQASDACESTRSPAEVEAAADSLGVPEKDTEDAEIKKPKEGKEGSEEAPDSADAATTGESEAIAAQGAEVSGEAAERSYTLREPSHRPRYAPRRGRRGRGRFNRGPRPDGGARRQDQPRGSNEQAVQINEVLKEGQEILVQIAKEPLGTKGARITSHVALPGRYLVYMPTIQHIGVSRKIGSEEERLRLRNIILEHRGLLTGGIIVRTAAAGRSEEELQADVEFLARLWNEIRTRSEQSRAPALIHRDLTLVERILRDTLSPDFKCVRVDNETEYQNVLDFVHRFQPSLVGHVKLYTKDNPLFEEFGIQAEIDKALKPKVWLKSGGYIVINQTEALVAIDVNTGKYVGKTNRLEDTIVKTNIDAVKEIVRQVRLRDLGGIIVIDFIDMDDRRNRLKVVQALEEALRSDRAPTKILSFNEFGLVALTRKRVKQSLERTLSEQCPYCVGSGWIKSAATVCYEIMDEVKKMAQEIEGNVLTLRVNPEVARALKSREGLLTGEIERLTGKDLVIKSDSSVHQERFEIF